MCLQNFIKLSAAVHELSTVPWISDNSRLRSRISLERIKQSTSGKRRYKLQFFFHVRQKQLVKLWSTNKNDFHLWLMTLKINRFLRLSRHMFVHKLSAAVHELSWSQRKKTRTNTIQSVATLLFHRQHFDFCNKYCQLPLFSQWPFNFFKINNVKKKERLQTRFYI